MGAIFIWEFTVVSEVVLDIFVGARKGDGDRGVVGDLFMRTTDGSGPAASMTLFVGA
jgi:hypothetical protein